MTIALIGAGFVGSQILKEALYREYAVTVIVRHPEKVPAQNNLTVKKGDVFDVAGLATLLKGHEAVINAFNPGAGQKKAYGLMYQGTLNIMTAAKMAGVKRILIVGGAGSLEVSPNLQLVDTPDFPKEWFNLASGLRDALKEIKKEVVLDWSFLSPSALLQPGEKTNKYRIGSDQLLVDANGVSRISVEDFANALLDELDRPMHVRKRFTVGY